MKKTRQIWTEAYPTRDLRMGMALQNHPTLKYRAQAHQPAASLRLHPEWGLCKTLGEVVS